MYYNNEPLYHHLIRLESLKEDLDKFFDGLKISVNIPIESYNIGNTVGKYLDEETTILVNDIYKDDFIKLSYSIKN